jgi:hypothetical protein
MRIHFCVLFVFTMTLLAVSQTTNAQFDLYGEVRNHRYCEINKMIAGLRIKFGVTLTNHGNDVLVYAPISPLLLISSTRANLQNGNYLFKLYPPMPSPLSQATQSGAAKSVRHILHRGEVFESETTERMIPTRSTTYRSETIDALAPGTYYARLVVEAQIQGTSSFISSSSQPIEIAVESRPSLQKCK